MDLPYSQFIKYLVCLILGGLFIYLLMDTKVDSLEYDLEESNLMYEEAEELLYRRTLELDSLAAMSDSVHIEYVEVVKEVEVLSRRSGELTEDAIRLTNLDSINVVTAEEYSDIKKELRKHYLK